VAIGCVAFVIDDEIAANGHVALATDGQRDTTDGDIPATVCQRNMTGDVRPVTRDQRDITLHVAMASVHERFATVGDEVANGSGQDMGGGSGFENFLSDAVAGRKPNRSPVTNATSGSMSRWPAFTNASRPLVTKWRTVAGRTWVVAGGWNFFHDFISGGKQNVIGGESDIGDGE